MFVAIVLLWHDGGYGGSLPGVDSSLGEPPPLPLLNQMVAEMHACVVGAVVIDAIAWRQIRVTNKNLIDRITVLQDWHVSSVVDLLCNEASHAIDNYEEPEGGERGSVAFLQLLGIFLSSNYTRRLCLDSILESLCQKKVLRRIEGCSMCERYSCDKTAVESLKLRLRSIVMGDDCPCMFLVCASQ